MRQKLICLLVVLILICSEAQGEMYVAEEGSVSVDAQIFNPGLEAIENIEIKPIGFSIEDVEKAFSLNDPDAYLADQLYGFIFETPEGQSVTDAMWMIDHDNADNMRAFDLSFMTLDEACAKVISDFESLGIKVCLEAAYAIDAAEYDRLYAMHSEWIIDQGREHRTWDREEICYVIYLNASYNEIAVYPNLYYSEMIPGNASGTEILALLGPNGYIYLSAMWCTEEVRRDNKEPVLNIEEATQRLTETYNYILSTTKQNILIQQITFKYVSFLENDTLKLRPFWQFDAEFTDGTSVDYLVDARNGEVYGT